jgi:drug/metabolite transporter (DMT)-like permease
MAAGRRRPDGYRRLVTSEPPAPRSLADALEHRLAPVAVAIGATVLWSLGNLMAAASDLPGPQLAFWRITFGAVLYQLVFRLRGGRMRIETLRTATTGGLAFGLSSILFFTALQTTSVASVTVILALQPVLLLPYAVRRLGERVDGARLVLMALAILGTVVAVLAGSSSGTHSVLGDVLAFAGTLVGCAYFVGTKRARESLGTIEYQAAALTVGAVVALAGALVTGPGLVTPDAGDLGWALLLTVVPGTGHLMMSWAQAHLDVSTTSTITLDVVVLSSLGAVLAFGQSLVPAQVLGMAVVLVALALFVRRASAASLPEPADVPIAGGD